MIIACHHVGNKMLGGHNYTLRLYICIDLLLWGDPRDRGMGVGNRGGGVAHWGFDMFLGNVRPQHKSVCDMCE